MCVKCAARTALVEAARAQTSIASQTQAEPKCVCAQRAPSSGARVAEGVVELQSHTDEETARAT